MSNLNIVITIFEEELLNFRLKRLDVIDLSFYDLS